MRVIGGGRCAEVLDVRVEGVLLVELVEQREAALEVGELAKDLQQPQADRVERAQVHLVQGELDAQIAQPVGDAGRQLARGLVGEGDDEERLGRDALVGDR